MVRNVHIKFSMCMYMYIQYKHTATGMVFRVWTGTSGRNVGGSSCIAAGGRCPQIYSTSSHSYMRRYMYTHMCTCTLGTVLAFLGIPPCYLKYICSVTTQCKTSCTHLVTLFSFLCMGNVISTCMQRCTILCFVLPIRTWVSLYASFPAVAFGLDVLCKAAVVREEARLQNYT